jgi:replicative DNA helicase
MVDERQYPDEAEAFENILKAEAYAQFAERQTRPVEAVPTPWPGLNTECRGDGGRKGLALGWHVILAGGTNMGKTNLAMNMAARIVQEGYACMIVSLEMARHQIKQRIYSILSGIESDRLARGEFQPSTVQELHAMDHRLTETSGVPPLLLVNDKPIRNIYQIAGQLDHYRDKYGCRVFIIDYLQLCQTGTDEDRRRQVMEISAQLMAYAHHHEALTIGLSQFNRSTSKEKRASPEVEGLTESSSLENDADMVLLLDHSKYEQDVELPWIHRTWLKIGKNREGGKGSIPIEWNWKNYRCREALPDETQRWPGMNGTK